MFWTLFFLSPAGFVVALILYQIVRLVLDRIRIRDVTQKSVLITGCDTGFGFDLALKCHKQGMFVFSGCYSKEGIERLERRNEGNTGRIRPFLLDICSDESVEEAKKFVEKTLLDERRELHYFVNNAGWGRVGFDDWIKHQDYLAAIDVNALGMIRVTHAFKHLIKKSKGRIINMTSVSGRQAVPGYGPYIVSKFAAEGYTDVLRLENLRRRWRLEKRRISSGDASLCREGDHHRSGILSHSCDFRLSECKPIPACVEQCAGCRPRRVWAEVVAQSYLPLSLLPTYVSDFVVEQLFERLAK